MMLRSAPESKQSKEERVGDALVMLADGATFKKVKETTGVGNSTTFR